MIRYFKILLLPIAFLCLASCENENNYSQLLKQEQRMIDNWLAANGYTLLEKFPADSVFGEKEMYHFEDDIYFQMLRKGDGDSLRIGDELILRYRQVSLDGFAVVEDYWTTMDRPYPNEIIYGSLANSCEGWQKAFEQMGRSGAEARIIVPSKKGRNNAVVVPYIYEMKVRKTPK